MAFFPTVLGLSKSDIKVCLSDYLKPLSLIKKKAERVKDVRMKIEFQSSTALQNLIKFIPTSPSFQ